MATGVASMKKMMIGRAKASKPMSPPPIRTSTNPSHVDIHHLRDLFISANLSSHQFPNITSGGRVEPVDPDKLSTAVAHSSVVVSVFTSQSYSWANNNTRQLVGFGRAVSDNALTASIHDVVVLPSLQGLGIGRKIVNTILRLLTSRDIYDISALCSQKHRLFFEACGFGDDILASTTMVYTKAPPEQNLSGDKVVISAGRKLLVVPPSRGLHLR